MRKLTTLLPPAIAIVATTPAHAIETETTTGSCLINGQSSICSESYTRLSFIEATQIDIAHVRGIFAGPGYSVDLTKNSTVSVLVPPSWTAKAFFATVEPIRDLQCPYALELDAAAVGNTLRARSSYT